LPGADRPGRHQDHSGLRHGLRMLGSAGRHERRESSRTHILVTHYHWTTFRDSVFFSAVCGEQRISFLQLRSKFLGRDSLKQVFEAQMALLFPVDMSAMSARRKFKEVDGGDSFTGCENKITGALAESPAGLPGLFESRHPRHSRLRHGQRAGRREMDESLRELAAGRTYSHDAQFTPEQLETTRKGWGHSSWLEGVR